MKNSYRKLLLAILISVVAISAVAQKQVIVRKVEPPNWWVGLPENPMLLLYGSGFSGANVSVQYPGVKVDRVEPGNEGYLFVWLKIAPNAKPGTAKFVVTSATGTATFDFPLLARASAESKYQGLNKDDVMCLIMPDRFANGDPSNDDPAAAKGFYDRRSPKGYHGGDLKGVQDHLPYLKDLGVTALWLTPFWKNDGRTADYHGYHVTDFYAVDEHFGTLREYQELVKAAHAQGIKFFFDYVVNHIGPYHVWAQNPPLPTWLHGTVTNHRKFDYQFQYLVDPHAPPQEWRNITDGWFPTAPPANALPDLNVDDPHVAKYMLDNAVWWMELGGLDGFRLDTFPYSSRKFWSGWHRELFRIYPTTNSIGEVWNFDPTITSFFEGGQKRWDGIDDGLPTMFDFPLFNTIRDVLVRNKPANSLPQMLRFDGLYARPEMLVTFTGNHDTRRFMGEEGMTPEKMKAAFGLLMTLRGIPQIYYGDEIAMPGGDDPDNRRDFPGGWPGDAQNAFTQQGRTAEQQKLFSYVRDLTALRRQHSALRNGHQWTIGASERYFAYLRDDGGEKILVIFNEGNDGISLPLSDTPMESAKSLEPLMGAPRAEVEGGEVKIAAPGFGVTIYKVK